MEIGELVEHLNRQTNRWPDSAWGGEESTLAGLAQYRLLKAIGDTRVIWAHGMSTKTDDGGVSLHALLFTEAYAVTDNAGGPKVKDQPRAGTTEVIPWTELTGLSLHEYWPDGTGSQTETAHFTMHMGNGRDFEIESGTTAGRPATLELLDFALRKLAAKK